jgi:hypothetical protein
MIKNKKIVVLIIMMLLASASQCFAFFSLDKTPPQQQQDGLVVSVEKNIVAFVTHTVESLRYSVYRMGGKRFDASKGVYILDCSNFVDHILQNVSPHAYSSLVSATGVNNPASRHYYEFFTDLTDNPDTHWNKIDNIEQLQPGDILVFRYKNSRGHETGGHVMIVMDKPIQDDNTFFVRVADSAPSAHSEDTRADTSGIGIGTLLLKANLQTGHPVAYAWGVDSDWSRNVKVAMARPREISAIS